MSDMQAIRTLDKELEDTRLLQLLKDLFLWWGRLIGIIIHSYTILLPARIRLYRYDKRRKQLNKA